MFLDANGDGRNDRSDSLRSGKWAEVVVWLDTVRNRDGNIGSLDGLATLAGYEFTIECSQRSVVEWGRFTPASPTMSIEGGPLKDSLAFYIRVRCDQPGQAGMQRLGRLKMRARNEGEVTIVPCRAIGEVAWTAFRTRPGDPWLRLGPTVETSDPPRATAGDWFDTDGLVISAQDPPDSRLFRTDHGVLYLDWNRMSPPYELRLTGGRLAVNGKALPKPERR